MAQGYRNLLQIIQAAELELGLPQSTSVIGNTSDVISQQMLGLAQLEVEELYNTKQDGWTNLQKEYNLIVNTPTITTGNIAQNNAVITGIPSTAGLTAQYFTVSASGFPIATRILSVDSATQVTCTMEATGNATNSPITFSQDTYPEPTDFGFFINKTWYDRTNRWQLIGPDTPQQDQFVRSGIVALGPRRHFRQIGPLGNNYRLWPAPSEIAEPLQLVFEYVTNQPILTGGTDSYAAQSKYWTTDTDVCLMNDRALIMGIKWRYYQQKGMNYVQLRTDYDVYVSRLISLDGGNRNLSLVPRTAPFLVNSYNAQDSNFPGPVDVAVG